LRSLKINKSLFKKTYLPIKSLELNLSNQMLRDRTESDRINYVINCINRMISGQNRNFLNKLKPLRVTILHAHGKEHKKFKWYFIDKGHAKSVLKWVREKDGKFDLIILIVCNPGKLKEIRTKKSLLIMPNNVFSLQRLENRWVKIKLIKPNNS